MNGHLSILTTISIILLSLQIKAQSINDPEYKRLQSIEANIDKYHDLDSFTIPTSIEQTYTAAYKYANNFKYQGNNIEKISQALTSPMNSDSLKIFSLVVFIKNNLSYDYIYANKITSKTFGYGTIEPKITLIYKKTVCEGYSSLFDELCKYSNLKSGSITSITHQVLLDEMTPNYLHSYNWVFIDNQYQILDLTWLDTDLRILSNTQTILKEAAKIKCNHISYPEKLKFITDFKKNNNYIYNKYYNIKIDTNNIDELFRRIYVDDIKTDTEIKQFLNSIEKEFNTPLEVFTIIHNQYYLTKSNDKSLYLFINYHYPTFIKNMDWEFKPSYNESRIDRFIKIIYGLKRIPTDREMLLLKNISDNTTLKNRLIRLGII